MIANAIKPSAVPERFPDNVRLRLLSVDQYLEMVRVGIITKEDNVELIEGWLVEKMGKNGAHNVTQMLLNRWLNRVLPSGWTLGVEIPVRLPTNVPEPDFTIASGHPRDFLSEPPTPDQIGLLIEISDTTLRSDQQEKLRRYAGAGIARYWIFNLAERQIEVYSNPQPENDPPTYASVQIYGEQNTIPLMLDGQEVAKTLVADLLP